MIAETHIRNEQLIRDEVLVHSGGYIESYEQIGTARRTDDDLIEVTIRATVKRNDLNNLLRSVPGIIEIAMDGRSLDAERITKEMSREDATEMLLDLLENFPANIYDLSATKTWRYDLDTRKVVVDVETKVDPRKYDAFVREFTDMLLLVGGRTGETVTVQLTRGESSSTAPGNTLLIRVPARRGTENATENVVPMPTVQFSIPRGSLSDRRSHGFVVADSWANLRVAGQQFPVNFQFYAVPEEVFRMTRPMFERKNMTVRAVDSNGNVLATGKTPAPAPSFNAQSFGSGFYVNRAMHNSNLVFVFPSLCIESHRSTRASWGPTLRPGMPEGKQQVFLDLPQAQMARATAVQIILE